MDLPLIKQTKASNLIKTTRKIIEKLFFLHKTKKIKEEDFKNKLDKLEELIIRNTDSLLSLQSEIEEYERVDPTMALVVEHFNHIGCFNTATLLASKFAIPSEQDFYKRLNLVSSELANYNFTPAFEFFKEFKTLFENNLMESKLKVHKFIYLCEAGQHKEGLRHLLYELKRNSLPVKSYLPHLIGLKVSTAFEASHRLLVNDFRLAILDAFNLSQFSRLSKRVEYGLMAFKTQECFKEATNKRCPACCEDLRLREDVPFNRHEQSIVLCRGSSEELDDVNQPFVYENGHVYGLNYIQKNKGIVVCPKTGKTSIKYPKTCYFV